jgi:hypothetical protein
VKHPSFKNAFISLDGPTVVKPPYFIKSWVNPDAKCVVVGTKLDLHLQLPVQQKMIMTAFTLTCLPHDFYSHPYSTCPHGTNEIMDHATYLDRPFEWMVDQYRGELAPKWQPKYTKTLQSIQRTGNI